MLINKRKGKENFPLLRAGYEKARESLGRHGKCKGLKGTRASRVEGSSLT